MQVKAAQELLLPPPGLGKSGVPGELLRIQPEQKSSQKVGCNADSPMKKVNFSLEHLQHFFSSCLARSQRCKLTNLKKFLWLAELLKLYEFILSSTNLSFCTLPVPRGERAVNEILERVRVSLREKRRGIKSRKVVIVFIIHFIN